MWSPWRERIRRGKRGTGNGRIVLDDKIGERFDGFDKDWRLQMRTDRVMPSPSD
jgi:hypothetical protein